MKHTRLSAQRGVVQEGGERREGTCDTSKLSNHGRHVRRRSEDVWVANGSNAGIRHAEHGQRERDESYVGGSELLSANERAAVAEELRHEFEFRSYGLKTGCTLCAG